MGWSFRKSFSFGPFRINLSKSGIGFSLGAKGFRVGQSSTGRRYTSVSIPGTGVRYQKSLPSAGSKTGNATAKKRTYKKTSSSDASRPIGEPPAAESGGWLSGFFSALAFTAVFTAARVGVACLIIGGGGWWLHS